MLDSICDDEETSDALVQVPVLDSTRIKETKNTLKNHESSLNRVRMCGSSQDENVTNINDEPTNSEIEKATATDVEKNINALQVMSCNVDDFLTSVKKCAFEFFADDCLQFIIRFVSTRSLEKENRAKRLLHYK